MKNVHESEGDKSAYDDYCIEDVPQVATVGARVKQYSAIDHLQVQWNDQTSRISLPAVDELGVSTLHVKYDQHVTTLNSMVQNF